MARKQFQPLKAFSPTRKIPGIGQRLFTGQTSGLGARFAGGPTEPFTFRRPVKRSRAIIGRAAKSGVSIERAVLGTRTKKGRRGGLIRGVKGTIRAGRGAAEFIKKTRTKTVPQVQQTVQAVKQKVTPKKGFQKVSPKQLQRQLAQPTPEFIRRKRAETKIQMPKSPPTNVKMPQTKNGKHLKKTNNKFVRAFDRAAAGKF